MNFIIVPQEKLDLLEASLIQIKGLLESKKPEGKGPNWISKKEACQRLKVCSKTLDSYLKKGILPFTQFKSKIYIKSSDIDAHLEKYYVTKN
jgi:excisionase family DNA binding protein